MTILVVTEIGETAQLRPGFDEGSVSQGHVQVFLRKELYVMQPRPTDRNQDWGPKLVFDSDGSVLRIGNPEVLIHGLEAWDNAQWAPRGKDMLNVQCRVHGIDIRVGQVGEGCVGEVGAGVVEDIHLDHIVEYSVSTPDHGI